MRKLSARKHRWQQQLFVAEGRKVVQELLNEGLFPKFLLAEEGTAWADSAEVSLPAAEFQKWSHLEQSDEVLGVFPFPRFQDEISDAIVVLDGLKDPGNLGTIIRSCDWFGVNRLYCTRGTVDVFNSKTVQSSMGSIARVQVIYAEQEEIWKKVQNSHRLLCADMEGVAMNELKISGNFALVMGSESQGVSLFWKEKAEKVTIPRKGSSKVESLNVAIATAVILGCLRLP